MVLKVGENLRSMRRNEDEVEIDIVKEYFYRRECKNGIKVVGKI